MSWIITGTQKNNWTPADIDTALWLDAADASTITESGGAVSQWNDKSGNGRNASQAVAGAMPQYIAAGLNNKNVVTFNGSNSIGTSLSFTLANLVVCVAKRSSTSQPVAEWGTAAHRGLWGSNLGFKTHTLYSTNGGSLTDFAGSQLNDYIIVSGITLAANANLKFILGAGAPGYSPLNGGISEIIATNNLENRKIIEGYLAHKWGLTANLPADHPYKTAVPVP